MNQQELYKKLQELELHGTIEYPSKEKSTMIITRVIGGWIYEMITDEGDGEFTYRPVFVPYSTESKFIKSSGDPYILK